MSYRGSSNTRDKSKQRIDPNTQLAKTKLSQTATSTDSSKYPPIKRDSIKNNAPPLPPPKSKLKEEDLMTESKIIQAKHGLQLLKKKMSQKGLLPTKSETQQRDQNQYEEVENTGSAYQQPKSKMLVSEKQIRPKAQKQPLKKRTSEVVRAQEPQYINPRQQAPIRPKNNDFEKMLEEQLKKQQIHKSVVNKVSAIKQSKNQIPSQYAQNETLYECTVGCGRKFKEETLAKHQKVCEKVFMQKRKAFDSAAQRHLQQQVKIVAPKSKLASKASTQAKKQPKVEAKESKQAMPKWKLQSLQLRSGLKRAAQKQLSKEEAKYQEMQKDAMVQCSFCGRRFNENAATRHIPFCQQQSKKMGSKLNSTTQNIKKKW